MKDHPIQQKQLASASPEQSNPESEGKSLAPPAFQLMASDGADAPPVQRKSESGGLPGDLVNGFAASTGHDLSNVNVHRNSDKPSQVGALAYAQGNDIHLGAGQDQHLAHEAAHIVQQREGRVQANTEVGGMPVNDSKSLESEADNMGAKAAQMKADSFSAGQQTTAGSGGPVQRAIVPTAQDYKDHATIMAMKVETFEAYVQKQADWHASPSLNDTQRDEIRTILEFARREGILSGLTDMLMSDVQAQIMAVGKADVFKYLEQYCKAVRQDPFRITLTANVADAMKSGKTLETLKKGFPDWVLRTAMKEEKFLRLRNEGLEADLVKYVTTSTPKPIFQAENGKDFHSYMEMRLTDKKDPLDYNVAPIAGNIRSFHRFQADVFEQLKTNYADTSKKKPLLLVLHSAVDHNGAFHREPGFTDVIKNKANNAIMIEGRETMGEIEKEIPALAKKYGVNDKVDQVMFAGHGESGSMQLGGKIEEDTSDHTIKEKIEDIDPTNNKKDTESLMKAIFDNMDKKGDKGALQPNRRIAFNACLTNSHDLSGETLSVDPDTARKEIKAFLSTPRNLVDWAQDFAKSNNNVGITGVGSVASFGWADYVDSKGKLSIKSKSDPKLSSSKLEYVREGQEAAGALRAVMECWGTQPKDCKAAMKARISKPETDWNGVIIQTLYDMIVNKYWGNAPKINKLGVVAAVIGEMRQEAQCRVSELAGFPKSDPEVVSKLFGALPGSDEWSSKDYIPLVFYQLWMSRTLQASNTAAASKMLNGAIAVTSTARRDTADQDVKDAKANQTQAETDLKAMQAAKAKVDKDKKSTAKDRKDAADAVTKANDALAKAKKAVTDALAQQKTAVADEKKAAADAKKADADDVTAKADHTAKADGFLGQLSTKFDCNTAKEFVDIDFLDKEGHIPTLLASGSSKGQLMLALLGVLHTSVQSDCKAYLITQLVGDVFPAALGVKGLLAGLATEDEILIAIGKKSAPSKAVASGNEGNVSIKGETKNTERVQSVTYEGEITADDTKVFKESDKKIELGKLKKGTKVHVLGTLTSAWAIEYYYTDKKQQGTGFVDTAGVKKL